VSTATGLHSHQAALEISGVSHKLGTRESFFGDHIPVFVHRDKVEYCLSDINPNRPNLHEKSPFLSLTITLPGRRIKRRIIPLPKN
jgi:hypothetical protein